ncbi:hypothetical protein ACIRVF_40840 [Kitasatospora sp. NPDC101157]|uniref:hypothetical protein n=1 Tax=Kitasatospora sp. NPDC101157 TaxID=3364098 RepID=UPI0038123AB9
MSEPDKFEDDLLYAITRTGEGFRPDQADQPGMVAGGYQRGRRRWRRRSAAAVVGGAAALALVGTGTVYLTGKGAASGGTATVAAASGGAASGSTASGPAVTPASAGTPSAKAVTGPEVLAAFQALLPKGQVTDGTGTGTEPAPGKPGGGGNAGATLIFDDGQGKAAMGISLTRLAPNDPNRAQNTCPDKKLVPYDACTASSLPGGGSLTVFQGYEYPDKHVSTKWWDAKLIGKDGRQIELSEWNSPAEKGAPDSRPTPPLSPDQLRAIVTDKSWDQVIAAIPEPKPVKLPDTGKGYSAREILETTAELLPKGLTETETAGDGSGYANFVLDDGKGKSLVQLNVQDWSGGRDSGGLFGDARTLPDGTKVVVRKEGGNPGMWTVDTLHPDGLRVVISSFNSGTQKTPATRKTPVLTDDQMQAIAAAPVWKLKK